MSEQREYFFIFYIKFDNYTSFRNKCVQAQILNTYVTFSKQVDYMDGQLSV